MEDAGQTDKQAKAAECPRCGETAYRDDGSTGTLYVLGALFIIPGLFVLLQGYLIGPLIFLAIGALFIAMPHVGKDMMKCQNCDKRFTA